MSNDPGSENLVWKMEGHWLFLFKATQICTKFVFLIKQIKCYCVWVTSHLQTRHLMVHYPPPEIPAAVNLNVDTMLTVPLMAQCCQLASTAQYSLIFAEIRNLVSTAISFSYREQPQWHIAKTLSLLSPINLSTLRFKWDLLDLFERYIKEWGNKATSLSS